MSSNVMKVVRVTEDVHKRLANLGKMGDTYNDVIERLLNEYEEYIDIMEAEEEIEKGLIKSYSNLDDFKSDIEKLDGNIIFISDKELDDFDVVNQELDIIRLMNYYKDNEIDSFLLKPNYLKKIEAEEKND